MSSTLRSRRACAVPARPGIPRGRLARLAGLFVTAALGADVAAGQFLNRALYLGEEPVRRDYDQGEEYFLDRFSNVDLPAWWNEPLDPFADRLLASGGSVSSDQLSLEGRAALSHRLGDGVSTRFDYLHSENQSTRFQRVAWGLEYDLSPANAAFLQLEGTAEKASADLSLGAHLARSERGSTRVMLTLVDLAAAKTDEFEYPRRPFGAMVAGLHRWDDGAQVYYELDAQLPFERRSALDGSELSMWRGIALGELRLPLGPRDRLVLSGYAELADKELRPAAIGDPLEEDHSSDLGRVRLEWWRNLDDERELSLGLSWLRLRTDGERPNAPAEDLVEERDELLTVSRMSLPLGSRWLFEPALWAGWIDYEQLDEGVRRSADGLRAKLGTPMVYRFGPHARLALALSFDLDDLAFGGGGVQLSARL